MGHPLILGPDGNGVDLGRFVRSECLWTRIDVARAAAWNPVPREVDVLVTRQLLVDPDRDVRRETAFGLWRICERLRATELDTVLTYALVALNGESDEAVASAIASSLRRTRLLVPDAERVLGSKWSPTEPAHVPVRRPTGYRNIKYAWKDGVVGVSCPLRVGTHETVFLHRHGRIHGLAVSELVEEVGACFAVDLDRGAPNEGVASSSSAHPDTLHAIEMALGLPDVRAAVARLRKQGGS